MFTLPQRKPNALQAVIDRKLLDIVEKDPTTKEFAEATDQIVKLHKLKSNETRERVSPNELIKAATSIGGIILILNHEHVHPITTKALGFVRKAS